MESESSDEDKPIAEVYADESFDPAETLQEGNRASTVGHGLGVENAAIHRNTSLKAAVNVRLSDSIKIVQRKDTFGSKWEQGLKGGSQRRNSLRYISYSDKWDRGAGTLYLYKFHPDITYKSISKRKEARIGSERVGVINVCHSSTFWVDKRLQCSDGNIYLHLVEGGWIFTFDFHDGTLEAKLTNPICMCVRSERTIHVVKASAIPNIKTNAIQIRPTALDSHRNVSEKESSTKAANQLPGSMSHSALTSQPKCDLASGVQVSCKAASTMPQSGRKEFADQSVANPSINLDHANKTSSANIHHVRIRGGHEKSAAQSSVGNPTLSTQPPQNIAPAFNLQLSFKEKVGKMLLQSSRGISTAGVLSTVSSSGRTRRRTQSNSNVDRKANSRQTISANSYSSSRSIQRKHNISPQHGTISIQSKKFQGPSVGGNKSSQVANESRIVHVQSSIGRAKKSNSILSSQIGCTSQSSLKPGITEYKGGRDHKDVAAPRDQPSVILSNQETHSQLASELSTECSKLGLPTSKPFDSESAQKCQTSSLRKKENSSGLTRLNGKSPISIQSDNKLPTEGVSSEQSDPLTDVHHEKKQPGLRANSIVSHGDSPERISNTTDESESVSPSIKDNFSKNKKTTTKSEIPNGTEECVVSSGKAAHASNGKGICQDDTRPETIPFKQAETKLGKSEKPSIMYYTSLPTAQSVLLTGGQFKDKYASLVGKGRGWFYVKVENSEGGLVPVRSHWISPINDKGKKLLADGRIDSADSLLKRMENENSDQINGSKKEKKRRKKRNSQPSNSVGTHQAEELSAVAAETTPLFLGMDISAFEGSGRRARRNSGSKVSYSSAGKSIKPEKLREGARIQIFTSDNEAHKLGTLQTFLGSTRWRVLYDDGKTQDHNMDEEKYRVLANFTTCVALSRKGKRCMLPPIRGMPHCIHHATQEEKQTYKDSISKVQETSTKCFVSGKRPSKILKKGRQFRGFHGALNQTQSKCPDVDEELSSSTYNMRMINLALAYQLHSDEIPLKGAKEIFDALSEDASYPGEYTDKSKEAMKYIRRRYKVSPDADAWLRRQMTTWMRMSDSRSSRSRRKRSSNEIKQSSSQSNCAMSDDSPGSANTESGMSSQPETQARTKRPRLDEKVHSARTIGPVNEDKQSWYEDAENLFNSMMPEWTLPEEAPHKSAPNAVVENLGESTAVSVKDVEKWANEVGLIDHGTLEKLKATLMSPEGFGKSELPERKNFRNNVTSLTHHWALL